MDQANIENVMAELRQKYTAPDYELVPLELRMGLFVLRNPTHQEFMLYRKQAMNENEQHLASPNLFASTCIYPDKAALQRAMARWPGMAAAPKVQKALAYLAGTTDDLEGKG